MKYINIFKANTYITELEAEKAGLLVKLQEAEAAFTNLQDMSKDMTEKQAGHEQAIKDLIEAHEKQISEMKATHDESVKALEKSKEVTNETAAKKAADIVASLGVEAGTIKVEPKELVSQTNTYKVISHLPK